MSSTSINSVVDTILGTATSVVDTALGTATQNLTLTAIQDDEVDVGKVQSSATPNSNFPHLRLSSPKCLFADFEFLQTLFLLYIGDRSGKEMTSFAQVNKLWHKAAQPRLYFQLERSFSEPVLWCNSYDRPAEDASNAMYRVLEFYSEKRALFLLIDAREQNEEAVQMLHDALLADDEIPNRQNECEYCGTRFCWMDSSGASSASSNCYIDLIDAGRFTHGEALCEVKNFRHPYRQSLQTVIVNGALDATQLQSILEDENRHWARQKKTEKYFCGGDDGDDDSCRECGIRHPPGHFLISRIHDCLDRSQPLHKPGFLPIHDDSSWICIFNNYETNATCGYMIDARMANYQALKMLHRYLPPYGCGESYKLEFFPDTFESEPGVEFMSEEGVHSELLNHGVIMGKQPNLQIIRGEIDFQNMMQNFWKQKRSWGFPLNSIWIMQELSIVPGTERWPSSEEDIDFNDVKLIDMRTDESSGSC